MLNADKPLLSTNQEVPAETELSAAQLVEMGLGFLRRQYGIILSVSFLAIALATVYVLITPKSFIARADLFIDTRKIHVVQQPPVLGEMDFDAMAMATQLELLKSDNVALAVIKNLELTKDPEFAEPVSPMTDLLRKVHFLALSRGERTPSESELTETVLRTFQKNLIISRVGGSSVIEIEFTSTDRDRASQIANAVGDAYIEDQLDARRQATKRAVTWLQDRLPELRNQASAAEQAVVAFKAKNNIVGVEGRVIGSSDGAPAILRVLLPEQQMIALNSELGAARARTLEARARLDRIEAVLHANASSSTSIATVTDTLNNQIITPLRSKYLDYVSREAYISTRYGRDHGVAVSLRRQIAEVHRSILDELRRIAESYKSEYKIAEQRQATLQRSLDKEVAQSRTANQAQGPLRELERTAQQYRALEDTFLKRYVEVVQQESLPIAEARFISKALPPLTPSSPKSLRILALATVGGIAFGAGIAVLRESMNRVFRTRKQVAKALNTDCIALLPKLGLNQPMKSLSKKELTKTSDAQIILPNPDNCAIWTVINSPFSQYSESIHSLKLSLNESIKSSKVIGFTSSLPGEGKSTVAASFALLTAQTGARVILVDCDLRNPSLSRLLAVSATGGIVDVLAGKTLLNNAIWKEPSTNLAFLPAGIESQLARSNEILASKAIKELFDQLRQRYEYIIVDLPPLAPIVDVRAAAEFVDLYTLIIEWGRTRIDLVEHALGEARVVRENLHAIVLNRVDFNLLTRYEGAGSKYYRKQYVAYGSRGMLSEPGRAILPSG